MLTALWLVLVALVVAKVALHFGREAPADEYALDRQIYKLYQVVALAKEDEARSGSTISDGAMSGISA